MTTSQPMTDSIRAKQQEHQFDPLVQAASDGDHDSFEVLMRLSYSEVRSFCSGRVINVDMLDEAVQNTFIRCYENLDRYRGGNTFLSWIKGIAKNICHELLRERKRHVAVEANILEQALLEHRLQRLDEQTLLEQCGGHLDGCIEELSPAAKALFEARYVQQGKVQDIAKHVRKNANWVSVNLHRIRDLLRRCLEKRASQGDLLT